MNHSRIQNTYITKPQISYKTGRLQQTKKILQWCWNVATALYATRELWEKVFMDFKNERKNI